MRFLFLLRFMMLMSGDKLFPGYSCALSECIDEDSREAR